jgi:hypothetical protein
MKDVDFVYAVAYARNVTSRYELLADRLFPGSKNMTFTYEIEIPPVIQQAILAQPPAQPTFANQS